jgi:hypothetical protein
LNLFAFAKWFEANFRGVGAEQKQVIEQSAKTAIQNLLSFFILNNLFLRKIVTIKKAIQAKFQLFGKDISQRTVF